MYMSARYADVHETEVCYIRTTVVNNDYTQNRFPQPAPPRAPAAHRDNPAPGAEGRSRIFPEVFYPVKREGGSGARGKKAPRDA